MFKGRKANIFLFLIIGLSVSFLFSCASTAPLPETLNIVPPSEDVPKEIAAFSGIWKGMWYGAVDTALVVEKINAKEAEIIISAGAMPGYDTGMYFYAKVPVLPGPSFEWTDQEGYKFIYKMDKGLNKIKASLVEPNGTSWWGYLNRSESK